MPRPQAPARFSRVRVDLGAHMPASDFLVALEEPDARVENTAIQNLELAEVSANGTAFSNVVFRGCTFDAAKLSGCTFTDVLFTGCRLARADMGRSWLNRCDFRSCSAPGLSFLKSRLTSVSFADSQFSYVDFSEALADRLIAAETSLAEASIFSTRLHHVSLDRCDLTRATVFKTPLAGIDLSTCEIAGIRVSSDLRELRGATVSEEQAVQLAELLGVKVKEEEW